MSDLIERRHKRAVELADYLDDLMEHNNAQLVIDMDAEIERLRAAVEHCAVVRLCSKCAAAAEGRDDE